MSSRGPLARPLPTRASEAVLSDACRRIGEDEVHAWVALADEDLLAAWSPGDGPLSGLSMGVKDIIDLAGMSTRCGSPITPETPAARSASLVERLVALGVVPVGKTVTTEFAYFSPGPTGNPRAPGRTPGGSSSGSAAAVAAGHVPLALGSQTAGSVTRPAAYCGIAGLVLTHGAVPLDGFSRLASSLDSAGMLADTVALLARTYAALLPAPGSDRPARRVLIWDGGELDEASAGMRDAVARSAAALGGVGVEVGILDDVLPIARLARDHATVMAYEVARERPDLVAEHGRLSVSLRELLRRGAEIPEAAYRDARSNARVARDRLTDILDGDTVILGPAAPGPAPRGIGATGSPIMSRPWQLLGLPQVTVPGAVDGAGLPLGVQLIGAPRTESLLLATGRSLEASSAVVGAPAASPGPIP